MKKLLFVAIPALMLAGCEEDTFWSINDVITDRVGIRYQEADQCSCPESQQAYVLGLHSKVSRLIYDTTVTISGGEPSSDRKEVTVPALSPPIALGCTVGEPSDDHPEGNMCEIQTAFSFIDRGPARSSNSFGVARTATREGLQALAIEGANFCAEACSSNDPFQCFPLGNSFPSVTASLVDLYDSAVSNGYSEVPAETANELLGVEGQSIPDNCMRDDTTIDADTGTVRNLASNPGPENWSCGISSRSIALASNRNFDPDTPAFTVHFPNEFAADVLDGSGGVVSADQRIESRILAASDFRNALVMEFPNNSQIVDDNGEEYASNLTAINTIFGMDDKLILRTLDGCISMDR